MERTLIAPPGSRVGPVTPEERRVLIGADAVGAKYDQAIDRESAEELLAAKAREAGAAAAQASATEAAARSVAAQAKAEARAQVSAARAGPDSLWTKMAGSAARAASSSIGRQAANAIGREVFGTRRRGGGDALGSIGTAVVRGVLGGLFRGR